MIENDPFAPDHSEVHSVKPYFGKGDILHLSPREERSRHTTTAECHAGEGGLLHIRAREVASLHQDIYEAEAVEISRRE